MPLYAFHGLFWCVFAVRVLAGRRAVVAPAGDVSTRAKTSSVARHPQLWVRLHGATLGVLYFSIGDALIGRHLSWRLFAPQPVAGAALIVGGAALALSALLFFRSWKFSAALQKGHELATTGPFAWVRHPIYTAIDLLALGSFLWLPTGLVLLGFLLVALVADLRARTEERLLVDVFGDRYRDYMRRVRRFVPCVY